MKNKLCISLSVLAASLLLLAAAVPDRPSASGQSLTRVQRKLIVIPKGGRYGEFRFPAAVNPDRTLVVLSAAVGKAGANNPTAPNGACVSELTKEKLTILVDIDFVEERLVSAEVIEFR